MSQVKKKKKKLSANLDVTLQNIMAYKADF